jgi:hypothetical protein
VVERARLLKKFEVKNVAVLLARLSGFNGESEPRTQDLGQP